MEIYSSAGFLFTHEETGRDQCRVHSRSLHLICGPTRTLELYGGRPRSPAPPVRSLAAAGSLINQFSAHGQLELGGTRQKRIVSSGRDSPASKRTPRNNQGI